MENSFTLPERITPPFIAASRNRILSLGDKAGPVKLDARALGQLDSLGMAFLSGLQRELKESGRELILQGLSENLQKRLAQGFSLDAPSPPPQEPGIAERLGASGYAFYSEIRDMLLLFSESLYWSTFALFRRKTLPKGETITQMVRLGSSALPIVMLLSLLIGFTLAVQSGNQLQQYGATLFMADGLGIGMVTEIAPVLTAVIIAGRSGSAITAEISTMAVQEEIAALQTMAINPIEYLLLPRFWALSVSLPLLTALAAAAGIFSGLLVAFLQFHLSMRSFMIELGQAVLLKYVLQMLIKSLTFGSIIALVSVSKGLRVAGGADAVGRATTECVVTCIFSIIVADAIFSFFFYF